MLDTIVIGAGQAGLGVGWHLAQRGVDALILERGRVGETWRSQRWDSFELNTPNWMNHLPGHTFEQGDQDGFAPTATLIRSFEEAARDLSVRAGVEVSSLQSDGDSYRLETTEGARRAKSVVLACGNLNVPRIPDAAATLPPGIHQVNTADYRTAGQLPAGSVLVVGGGQSGAQIVEDLLKAGRRVYFSISAATRLPRRYRGTDLMAWWEDMGIWDITPDQVDDPAMLRATNPLISGLGRYGHSVSYQWLARQGATILGRFEQVVDGRFQTDGRANEYIAAADRFSAEWRDRIDAWIAEQAIAAPPPEGDPGDSPYAGEPIEVLSEVDLEAAGISTVIWATGFRGDFSWVDLPILDDRGNPRHTNGRTDAPGVYCLGFGWTSNRRSGVIAGIEADAARIADDIADFLGS